MESSGSAVSYPVEFTNLFFNLSANKHDDQQDPDIALLKKSLF